MMCKNGNLNFNEIKRLFLLSFSLFIKINVIKFKKKKNFDNNEIISLFKFLKKTKLKELFDLNISKISSDGGDYPRIETALIFIFFVNR